MGLIIGLVSVPLVAHQTGAVGFGMWSLCALLIGWIQAMDLGLGIGLQNDVSRAIDLRSRQVAVRAAAAMRVCMRVIALVVIVLGTSAALTPQSLLIFGHGLDQHERDFGRGLLVITSMAMALSLITQTSVRCLGGMQRLGRVSVAQSLGGLVGLTVFSTGMIMDWNPLMGIAALALLPAASQLIAAQLLLRAPDLAWLHETTAWNMRDLRRLMGRGAWFFSSQISALVVFQTDALVISANVGVIDSGSYQAANRLFSIIVMGQGVVLAAVWPSLGNAQAAGDQNWIEQTYRRARTMTMLLIVLSLMAGLGMPWFVETWTNKPELRPSFATASGLALLSATSLWANLHAQCLNALDDYRFPAKLAMIQAVLNLVTILIAVRQGGAAGVAWGSAVVAMVTSCSVLAWRWHHLRGV